MTVNTKNLSVLAYANGFTLWHLSTTDALNAIDTQGYLNSVSEMVREKDVIFASASDGTGIFTVRSNADGVVDLSDSIAKAEQDTD